MQNGTLAATLILILAMARCSPADDHPGRLMLIGGGLHPFNEVIFKRLVEIAGGPNKARFVILPTAGRDPQAYARVFRERLARYEIPPEHCEILDVTVENADRSTTDPALIAQVQRSTCLFMTGGDQNRVVRALLKCDGTDRPLLAEIRRFYRRGGVIAGSSAGAAAQSDLMISVAGLPDEALDEGLDALDFGLSKRYVRRGLWVSRGLGLFGAGLVDQHFQQYRGRLARLARALSERRIRYGFGIDEDTALVTASDGTLEVVGLGHVTLVDAANAVLEDGPLGCHIRNLGISLMAAGDCWDEVKGTIMVHRDKKEIDAIKVPNVGSFPIPDIAAPGAVRFALISGLADNSQNRQLGITLKHHDTFAHGYRYIFQKTNDTHAYDGYVDGAFGYTVVGVRLDIEPVNARLRPPSELLPLDLPVEPSRTALLALWHRGILTVNESHQLRPGEPVTREEFAQMLSRACHLLPPRHGPLELADVRPESVFVDDVMRVVVAGLMTLDANCSFRPTAPLSRREAALALDRFARRVGYDLGPENLPVIVDLKQAPDAEHRAIQTVVSAGWLSARQDCFEPSAPCTREEAAVAIYRILGFSW